MSSKISYKPLFKTISERYILLTDIARALEFSSATVAKFDKNELVSLGTIVKICDYLDVPIEKVVQMSRFLDSRD